jgi:lipopolysaccharide/colanic/teichoic acid biosynthesis glycosyltransferase
MRGVFSKKLLLWIIDSVLFSVSLYAALYIRRPDIFTNDYFLAHIPRFAIIYFFFIISVYVAGLYDFPQFMLKVRRIKLLSYIALAYVLFGNTFFYLLPSNYTPKVVLLMQAAILFILTVLWRVLADRILKTHRKTRALLLDDSVEGVELRDHIAINDYGIEFVSHMQVSMFDIDKDPKGVLLSTLHHNRVEMIVADIKNEKVVTLLPHIYALGTYGVKLYDVRSLYQYVFRKMPLSAVGYFWFFEQVSLDTKVYEALKRIIDIIISIPVLVVLALLHPWVAHKIRQEDAGPVFIYQKRIGRYGKEIIIKKYRTMTHSDNGVWLGESKNKVTNIGYFLRKTRIDEFPQILAVLNGDLSLVGPRTDMSNLAQKIEQEIPYYMIRYSVTPGLSGWAQTMMNKPPQTMEETTERLQYDLYYVRNRGIFLDIIIILRTIKTMLSQEGM